MSKMLKRHGVFLNQETSEKLWEFHQLLRQHNHDQDLTRLNSFETIVQKHYADCLIINALVPDWPSPLLDLGSGAGFPGIPLKLSNPQVEIILAEPRPRRVEFLNLVIEKLGLKKITVFPHKVTSRSMTVPLGGMVCRAFDDIADSLPRLDQAFAKGSRAFFMKGPAVKEELKTFKHDQFKVLKTHWYTIPETTHHRALVILEKI